MFGHTIQFCLKGDRPPKFSKCLTEESGMLPLRVVGLLAKTDHNLEEDEVDHFHEHIVPIGKLSMSTAILALSIVEALAKEPSKNISKSDPIANVPFDHRDRFRDN